MKIVLDTNCLIPILIPGTYGYDIWKAFRFGRYTLCVTTEILLEYEEILTQKASPLIAEIIMKIFATRRNVVKIEPAWRFNMIKADPDDNKFVDCAICGNAEYIVSNDTHFSSLKHINFPIVIVLRIQEFIKLI